MRESLHRFSRISLERSTKAILLFSSINAILIPRIEAPLKRISPYDIVSKFTLNTFNIFLEQAGIFAAF